MISSDAIDNLLRRGVALHQTGKTDDAEQLYLQVIARRPNDANALGFLGAIAHHRQDFSTAADYFARAASIATTHAPFHYNSALALEAVGRIEEAEVAYQKAIALQTAYVDAWLNLGALLHQQAKFDSAADIFRRAIASIPGNSSLHLNLGLALSESGKFAEAEIALRRSIVLNPRHGPAHFGLANLLAATGRLDEAISAVAAALGREPSNPDYHSVLGNWLAQQGQWRESWAAHERAIKLSPTNSKFLANFGASLLMKGEFDLAQRQFERAIELDADNVDAYFNLALVLEDQGHSARALKALDRVLLLRPDHAMAHQTLASIYSSIDDEAAAKRHREAALRLGPNDPMILFSESLLALAEGDLAKGWAGYGNRFDLWNDSRYRHKGFHKRASPPPYWQAEDPAGKRFLVWTEQGVGDEVLFSGLIPEFAGQCAGVILECSDRMAPILERSFSNLKVDVHARSHSPTDRPIDADYQVAIGDLGRWLRPSIASFPGRTSYLAADPGKTETLRSRYGSGPLIGIAWRSRADRLSARKSYPLMAWREILQARGARFVSLQYGDYREEAKTVSQDLGVDVLWDSNVNALSNMDDFFAQVAAMDLIISVSNTAVHVAGALGKPVWVMLPSGPSRHWYWFKHQASSPWYPSMKLYREAHDLNQSTQVEKKKLVQCLAADLEAWLRVWKAR
ncbi:MAG: tetratricopeptide repeat protein [Rhodospirillaceae bacterium]|nr:tetratricopeptide repeat protein [Rhodospirillaceae bacterium]